MSDFLTSRVLGDFTVLGITKLKTLNLKEIISTGDATIGGALTVEGQIASNVNTGTAPFVVSSTTKVVNLNTDLFDDLTSSQFLRSDTADTVEGILTFNAIPAFNGGASGSSAPFTVDSNFLVTDLNANFLNGLVSASVNTPTTIVSRDASGNFSAGTITAALSGNASTATWADSVDVNTSSSTSFYDILWHSGDTLYSSTGSKFRVQPSTGTIQVAGNMDLNGGTMTTDATIFNFLTDNALLTNINIGHANTTVTIPGSLTVLGDIITNNVEVISTSNGVVFEGTVADDFELKLLAGALTADHTVTLKDRSGTILLLEDITDHSINPKFGSTIGLGNDSAIIQFNDSTNDTLTDYWASKDALYIQGDSNNVSNVVLRTGYFHLSHNGYIGGNFGIAGNLKFEGATQRNALDMNNNKIIGADSIALSDGGPDGYIQLSSWSVFNSPNDLTTNSDGNFQFVHGGVRKASINTSGQIEIPVSTGTAPFVVSSTTKVGNLNVDFIDGYSIDSLIYGDNSVGLMNAPDTFDQTNKAFYRPGFWDINNGSWAPTNDWWWGLNLAHDSNSPSYLYGAQIAVKNATDAIMAYRSMAGGASGVLNDWKTVMNLEDNQTISGIKTFSAIPSFNGGTSASTSPFTVDSTFMVTNLNAEYLGGQKADYYGVKTDSVFYVIGNTSGTAGTWTGTIPGLTAYYDGLTIRYKIGIEDADPTYLDINGLGQVQVYRYGTSRLTTHWTTDTIITLTYDETLNRWYNDADYDSTEDYNLRWESSIIFGEATLGYQLLLEGVDGKMYPITNGGNAGSTTNTVTNANLKIGGKILYYNSSTDRAADYQQSNYIYEGEYSGEMEYWSNKPTSGWAIAGMPFYLKCVEQSDGSYKVFGGGTAETDFITQTLPTSDDGYLYIQIGFMHDTGDAWRLQVDHPIYQYKYGRLRLREDNYKKDIAAAMTAGTSSAFTNPHLALKATSNTDNTGFVGMTFATSSTNNYGFSLGALRSTNGHGDLVIRNHYDNASGTEIFRLTEDGTTRTEKLEIGMGSARIEYNDTTESIDFIIA